MGGITTSILSKGGGNSLVDLQSINDTSLFSTSSLTYVDVTGFLIVTKDLGESGKYKITTELVVENSNANTDVSVIVVVDGVEIAGSEVTKEVPNANKRNIILTTTVVSNLSSGKIIRIRVKTTAGTLNVYQRTLNILGHTTSNVTELLSGTHPDVIVFAEKYGITTQKEIDALDVLYRGVNQLITNHRDVTNNGVGSVLYLNGVSPTSLDAAKAAITFGTGNEVATVPAGQASPTHTATGGLKFNGSTQVLNIGNVQNGRLQERVLTCFSRQNTITVAGVSMGSNGAASANKLWLYPRASTSNSGYIETNYPAFAFDSPGIWSGYNNGTTFGIWKDGVFQPPSSNSAPTGTATSTLGTFIGARNNDGSAINFVDEEIGCLVMLDDGGTLFTNAEIQTLSDLINDYETNVI